MPLRLSFFAFMAAALVALPAGPAAGQELDCRVTVNFAALTGTEYAFLGELAREVERYLNDRAWTEHRFQEVERIACTFGVVITEAEGLDRFRARLTVGSQRPVWGTPGRTPVFQVADGNWRFTYNRGQALVFDPNRFDPLTSVLDFYAYLILGYDFDTFAELGGTPYFEQARRVAELAQGQGAPDWQALGEDPSRATLIRQLLDPRFQPLRAAYFRYHFGGLDHFTTDHRAAWAEARRALDGIYELFLDTSRRYAIDVFFAAKAAELPDFFRDYPERSTLYARLIEMDPGRSASYDRLAR